MRLKVLSPNLATILVFKYKLIRINFIQDQAFDFSFRVMAIFFWALVILTISQVDGNNASTHQACPTQSEAMAFVKLVEDYVIYRKIDDLIIFDFFDVVQSSTSNISSTRHFNDLCFPDCSLVNFLFRRLILLLSEHLVKAQICFNPELMPFDLQKKTGRDDKWTRFFFFYFINFDFNFNLKRCYHNFLR